MRNLKTITTQDHVIHVIESSSISDDLSCADEMVLPESLTIFCVDGTLNLFSKASSGGDWSLAGNVTAPNWIFAKPNVVVGGVATTPMLTIIVFIPKNRVSYTPEPEYLGDLNVEEIDRESFVELGAHNSQQKADLNTYEAEILTLDEEVPDDVIIE